MLLTTFLTPCLDYFAYHTDSIKQTKKIYDNRSVSSPDVSSFYLVPLQQLWLHSAHLFTVLLQLLPFGSNIKREFWDPQFCALKVVRGESEGLGPETAPIESPLTTSQHLLIQSFAQPAIVVKSNYGHPFDPAPRYGSVGGRGVKWRRSGLRWT